MMMKTMTGRNLVGCGLMLAAGWLVAAAALAVPAMRIEPLCPVSDQPCDPKVSLDFHGGRIWFCCKKCKQAFEAEPARYTALAHQQMVLTRQFVQRACPLDAAAVAAGTQLDIGGVEVGFCSDACRSRVNEATVDEQTKLVFGNLGRGFVSVKTLAPKR
jgi:YHS domain-containing protein